MTARNLFNIIIKIIGIIFLKDLVMAIPSLLSVMFSTRWHTDGAFVSSGFSLIILFLYALIIYALLFRTNWVIDKLNLESGFTEEAIPLNIHRQTVLTIVIMVTALLVIISAIPLLLNQVIHYFMYRQVTRGFEPSMAPFDFGLMGVYAFQLIIGWILLANRKALVNYIELKRK